MLDSKIEIRCPTCNKKGIIKIPKETITKTNTGLVAINLGKNQICSHSFIAYLDRNLSVRDYFVADFHIELPEVSPKYLHKDKLFNFESLDVDLIKINLTALSLTYLIRSCLYNKRILYINENDFLFEHIKKLFDFIFTKSFSFSLSFIKKEEFNKKNYKNFIIIEKQRIIRDKDNILNPKAIKIERTFIQRFIAEVDPKLSLIFLKNEIQKTYHISNEIMKLINNYNGIEKIGKKDLVTTLCNNTMIKITFPYLDLLLEIIKHHYNFDLSKISAYFFPDLGI